MEAENMKMWELSSLISLAIISVLNFLIVVGKEYSSDFKGFFTAITGHHWSGHGVVILILFVLFTVIAYYMLQNEILFKKDMDLYKLTMWTMIILLICSFLIYFMFQGLYSGFLPHP